MNFRKDGINIILIIYVGLRIIHYFADSQALGIFSAALLVIVTVLSLPRMPRLTMIVLGTLLAAGASLMFAAGATASQWLAASLQNGNMVMLLICVPFISAPFYYEDYQSELKTFAQARMRNMLSFLLFVTLCSHVLAVVISIGAMMVIYNLMKPFARLYGAHEPLLRTIMRGYASSGFWSPAWASVIVYTAIPGVEWVRIIPIGIAFTILFCAMNLGSVYAEKKMHPGRYNDIKAVQGAVINKNMLITMLLLALSMIALIIVLNTATGWDLMLTVTIVSLLFPLAVALIQSHLKEFKIEALDFYDNSLMKVRDQAALFTLAGFFGKALDIAGFGALLTGLLPEWLKASPALMVFAILLLMILVACIGVHPAASGTAIVTALSPAALGLSSYTFCLTILFGWLMAIMMAPFSAVALLLSAATGRNTFSLSIFMNWKFCAVCLVVFSLLISLVGPVLG